MDIRSPWLNSSARVLLSQAGEEARQQSLEAERQEKFRKEKEEMLAKQAEEEARKLKEVCLKVFLVRCASEGVIADSTLWVIVKRQDRVAARVNAMRERVMKLAPVLKAAADKDAVGLGRAGTENEKTTPLERVWSTFRRRVNAYVCGIVVPQVSCVVSN